MQQTHLLLFHYFSIYLYLTIVSACQKADWSQHKKMCHKDNDFLAIPLALVVKVWLKENQLDILQGTEEVARSLGISRKDVVLEVDLKASNNPALLIKPVKDYIEGRGIPDWDWGCQIDLDRFIQRLKDMHSILADHQILVLHRSYDADCGICRISCGITRSM
jgi:hypothetical protein